MIKRKKINNLPAIQTTASPHLFTGNKQTEEALVAVLRYQYLPLNYKIIRF